MILIVFLIALNYYFIKIKNNEKAIFIVNTCLSLFILFSVFLYKTSTFDNLFYNEIDKEYLSNNLTGITYADIDTNPYIKSVTNEDGVIINFTPNSKIGIKSCQDKNISDNIYGKLETIKISYKLKSYLVNLIFIIPLDKDLYIYDITSFENYNLNNN